MDTTEYINAITARLFRWQAAALLIGVAFMVLAAYAVSVTLYVSVWHYTAQKWEVVAKRYGVQLKDCSDQRRRQNNS